MKHFNFKSFVLGVGATIFIAGLSVTALAATGAVTFNASALTLNGTQVSAKGENYTLANGQSVPASITYTDETGGGTTYLPVRRIAELMGVETGWDGATGSVTVKGEVKTPAEPTTPPDTTASTDYSDWSKEDEAAYQEFKAMWKVEFKAKPFVFAKTPDFNNAKQTFLSLGEDVVKAFAERFINECYESIAPTAKELTEFENRFLLNFYIGSESVENFTIPQYSFLAEFEVNDGVLGKVHVSYSEKDIIRAK